MKKDILLLFIVSLGVLITSCKKDYNQYGGESVYFLINGEPEVPTCEGNSLYTFGGRDPHYTDVYIDNNTFRLHICSKKASINFAVDNYHGAGIYYFDNAGNNTIRTDISSSYADYNNLKLANNNDTFLRIIEVDREHHLFSATFEIDMIDQNNVPLKITKGRIYISTKFNDPQHL